MLSIEQIAKVCHEVNKSYCECLGDNSQQSWEDAPDWQRRSAILGVKMHLDNPYASPAISHESWMKEKISDGWQYGPKKDPELQLHPCIVPFNELPTEQQAKDYIFKTIAVELGKITKLFGRTF